VHASDQDKADDDGADSSTTEDDEEDVWIAALA